MHPDSMSGMSATASPKTAIAESHMHGAVSRVDGLVADIEQSLEILQARLEPVVMHRPTEAPAELGNDRPLYAPLAAEIHHLADRLEKIRGSISHTLESLEV